MKIYLISNNSFLCQGLISMSKQLGICIDKIEFEDLPLSISTLNDIVIMHLCAETSHLSKYIKLINRRYKLIVLQTSSKIIQCNADVVLSSKIDRKSFVFELCQLKEKEKILKIKWSH